MRTLLLTALLFSPIFLSQASAQDQQLSKSQEKWVDFYKKQKFVPKADEMLINTSEEPVLTEGFTSLFDGKSLEGWSPVGGTCKFEAIDRTIVGTCVQGSPSTYLSTDKADYKNFVFTVEVKWEVDGNTGVIFRGKRAPDKNGETAVGPQAEMEEASKERYWSGGIYRQGAGGWAYPLWLESHKEVRDAIDRSGWNRLTIEADGPVVKTWVNGIPAAHWQTDEFFEGFFSLQIHSGKEGKVHFRNIKVKELPSE